MASVAASGQQLRLMVISASWPFNCLRARKTTEPGSEVVATVPVNFPQPQYGFRFKFTIDVGSSTATHWKLVADVDEGRGGWVVKEFEGQTTLVPYCPAVVDAARRLLNVKQQGDGILVMTGAGVSMNSGVSVFRRPYGVQTALCTTMCGVRQDSANRDSRRRRGFNS